MQSMTYDGVSLTVRSVRMATPQTITLNPSLPYFWVVFIVYSFFSNTQANQSSFYNTYDNLKLKDLRNRQKANEIQTKNRPFIHLKLTTM